MEFREILNVMKERPKQRTTDSGVNRKQNSKFFLNFIQKSFPLGVLTCKAQIHIIQKMDGSCVMLYDR